MNHSSFRSLVRRRREENNTETEKVIGARNYADQTRTNAENYKNHPGLVEG